MNNILDKLLLCDVMKSSNSELAMLVCDVMTIYCICYIGYVINQFQKVMYLLCWLLCNQFKILWLCCVIVKVCEMNKFENIYLTYELVVVILNKLALDNKN
jgi:hypothetical protein